MSESNAVVSDAMPSEFDPKQTHVVSQWKYTSPLICCRFCPSGQFVYSSAEDGQIQRWELTSGKPSPSKEHESWVLDIAVATDGSRVFSGGCDDQLIIWAATAEKLEPLIKIKAHDGWVRSLSLSSDGSLLVSAGNDHLVKLWDTETGEQLGQFEDHQCNVYSAIFAADGSSVFSGDLLGKVNQWETDSGKLLHQFDAKDLHSYNKGQKVDYGGVRSLSISPDNQSIACGGLHKASNPLGAINEPLVVVFDLQTQKPLRSHVSDGVRGTISRSSYLADGSIIGASAGSGGGYLVFWNPAEEKSTHKFKLKDTARGMDVHPDRLQVATTHWDRHLRVSRMAKKLEKQ